MAEGYTGELKMTDKWEDYAGAAPTFSGLLPKGWLSRWRNDYRAPRTYANAKTALMEGRKAFEEAGARFIRIQKPKRWPGPAAGKCEVAVMYDSKHLMACFDMAGGSFTGPDPDGLAAVAEAAAQVPPREDDGFAWAREAGQPEEFWSILNDDRVELFLWVAREGGEWQEEGSFYHAVECGREGQAIQMKVGFRKQWDWTWRARHSAACLPPPEGRDGNIMVLTIPWASYGLDLSAKAPPPPKLRMALCRGEKGADGEVNIWSSHVDPQDDEVNFHRPNVFGDLTLRDDPAAGTSTEPSKYGRVERKPLTGDDYWDGTQAGAIKTWLGEELPFSRPPPGHPKCVGAPSAAPPREGGEGPAKGDGPAVGEVWIRQPGPGEEAPTRVTIKKIHYEEDPPYYTVEMEGGGERQTERSRLSAVADGMPPARSSGHLAAAPEIQAAAPATPAGAAARGGGHDGAGESPMSYDGHATAAAALDATPLRGLLQAEKQRAALAHGETSGWEADTYIAFD